MGDASTIYAEAGNYYFVAAELFMRKGPQYGGRFDSCEGVIGALLFPEGESVGGYVFPDEDCKICFLVGRRRGVYTTNRCCSFSIFINRLVSKNAFMRGVLEDIAEWRMWIRD